ncbi:MAG TPA: hypothetical protein VFA68_00645 [Terriglobales bacterium]|nr:hypothetical protein [Terriglobales bacterium]
MKILILAAFCFAPMLGPFAHAQATWDLAKDLGQTSNQISFNQGSSQTWYFMESATRAHDPTQYRFMSQYLAPCQSSGSGDLVNGVGCWHGTESRFLDLRLTPEIAFNFTNSLLDAKDEWFVGYQPRAMLLTASWEHFAIVAWRSPFAGAIQIDGEFGWRNFFNSVAAAWNVDKGSSTLRSGSLYGGGFKGPVHIGRLPVSTGDVLYFIVDNSNDESCYCAMPVDFRVAITQVP